MKAGMTNNLLQSDKVDIGLTANKARLDRIAR